MANTQPSTRLAGVPAGCPLSPREFQIVEYLMDGLSYSQIGPKMGIQETSARSLAHNAFRRLGVPGRFAAVIKCWRNGWLDRGGSHPEAEHGEFAPPLSPQQRTYLAAFERWLRDPTRESFLARKAELAKL